MYFGEWVDDIGKIFCDYVVRYFEYNWGWFILSDDGVFLFF